MFRTNLVVVLLNPVSRLCRKILKQFRAVSPLRRAASSVQASCSMHDVLLRFWNVWRSITGLEKEQTKQTSWKENKSQGNIVRVVPTCEHVWPITSGVLCTREDLLSRWYLDKNRKHEKNQKTYGRDVLSYQTQFLHFTFHVFIDWIFVANVFETSWNH